MYNTYVDGFFMNNRIKEDFIKLQSDITQKHKFLRIPVLIITIIVLTFFNIIDLALRKRYKAALIVAGIIVFICSLSILGYTSALSMMISEGYIDTENITLYSENENLMVEKMDLVSEIYNQMSNIKPGTTVYNYNENKYISPDFKEDWSLIVVNKKHLIPRDYSVELGTIKGNIKCDYRIVDKVGDMIAAAKADGVSISICSPFRDNGRQVALYERKARSYIRQGYSEEEAHALASETVAIPGSSEHELGLAFDFITAGHAQLDAAFAETEAGKWLKENAADYGFILRYPADKTQITQIEFEPWHYRYVGAAAHEIMDNNLCLEEYALQVGIIDSLE